MHSWTRSRAHALPTLRWFLLLAGMWGGVWALLKWTLAAYGGKPRLWLFTSTPYHRYTSMAMLTGTLRLRNGLSKVGHDEQVFNGAGYTNWGFGVPALQLPFHAVAARVPSLFPSRFFPDRAIYFFYLAAMIPVLWAAFDRLLAMRAGEDGGRLRRHALSWSAVLVTLTAALYPLMSCRFLVYEETICYFVVCELAAIAAYIFALRSWSAPPLVGMGAAAGMGLLVRPTGLLYVGVLCSLVVLEGRSKKALAVFAAALAPFVTAWAYGNWVRTGSPFAFGLANSLPFFEFDTPMLRFGSACVDTAPHLMQATARLFRSFFVALPEDAGDPFSWMRRCHFELETRPPATESYALEPFFGIEVLILLGWMLFHLLARRERRLAAYVPFASLVALFGAYALAGAGFAWRYVGDFWPLIVLACVEYVRVLPVAANRVLGLRLALVFAALSASTYVRAIKPALPTVITLAPNQAATQWDAFSDSRWAMDVGVPSHLDCGDKLASLVNNGLGWNQECAVNTFTNVYLGVPFKGGDGYTVRFQVEGAAAPTLRVYLNGRLYTATRKGTTYTADVRIAYRALTSPTVVATIQWTRGLDLPRIKLRSIEIV
jgi:hypothetical protein